MIMTRNPHSENLSDEVQVCDPAETYVLSENVLYARCLNVGLHTRMSNTRAIFAWNSQHIYSQVSAFCFAFRRGF